MEPQQSENEKTSGVRTHNGNDEKEKERSAVRIGEIRIFLSHAEMVGYGAHLHQSRSLADDTRWQWEKRENQDYF